MADETSDALSIRGNVNEATIWLSIIFSWLTPYEWPADVLIIVGVSIVNYVTVKGNYEAAKRAGL